jgi:hypothetical protein
MSIDIRQRIELAHERRAHEQTRWWLFGVAFVLWLHVIIDLAFLLLR